jgi:hypothetical protein
MKFDLERFGEIQMMRVIQKSRKVEIGDNPSSFRAECDERVLPRVSKKTIKAKIIGDLT